MSDDPVKSILLVKKKDAKKGSLWHSLTNKRIIKQHGGFDIPEGDLHQIPKYNSPVETSPPSNEETNDVLSGIEKEINELKQKENQHTLPQQPTGQNQEYYDEEPLQREDQDDDLY